MLKKFIIILIIAFLLLGLCGNVLANDTNTATSAINGVTVNWQYDLNKSNQIVNLRCTNPKEVSGDVVIPSTLEGKTVISLGGVFTGATKITGVTIPNTVKEIGLWAFSGCTSLSKVDLGNVKKIDDQSFKGCTALTSIKLPKTLTEGASGAPFVGCTNLKNIELEEGMTIVPSHICARTPITEITIPSTVKEIDLWAFSGCTNLSKVDLGNVKKIGDQSFKGCTALTSIKLPKTLTEGVVGAPFVGCTNLKNIELEEGMTVIPSCICARTPITEITIPSTVKEIGLWAFSSCTSLKKITILDNVENMSDSTVFQNHNEDLTIYCYEDSVAAKYAIDYQIKYVYLPKTPSDNEEEPINPEEPTTPEKEPTKTPTTTKQPENTADGTSAKGTLPNTGKGTVLLGIIGILAIIASVMYSKNKKYRDIK